MVGRKKPDQQWNTEDAGQRDGIGQIHRGHRLSARSRKGWQCLIILHHAAGSNEAKRGVVVQFAQK
jgi:hypothetical protein